MQASIRRILMINVFYILFYLPGIIDTVLKARNTRNVLRPWMLPIELLFPEISNPMVKYLK